MKKSVGIITINDYDNYGNRLQNYATQEVLKDINVKPTTILNTMINYIDPIEENTTFINSNEKTVLIKKIDIGKLKPFETVKKISGKIQTVLSSKRVLPYKVERFKNFKNFTSTYIETTEFNITDNSLPKDLGEMFDYFVTGSDQVWNPYYRYGSSIDFLTFAPEYKRIALASSFGISKIPYEVKSQYSKWLNEMRCLSVREEAGARIIKELTDRDATVLIDPTLMLKKESWIKISKKAINKPKGKYLLTYFLDDISKEEKKWIEKISKKDKLVIINLKNIKDLESYSAGPSEFIDYVNDATLFLTNSFHGVIFSILLDTPFIVFDRKTNSSRPMNSRIDTLLKIFNLEHRHFDKIEKYEQIYIADYRHTEIILMTKRKEFSNYLLKSLDL